jgi:DNA-binding XRE family transcriptional regulator
MEGAGTVITTATNPELIRHALDAPRATLTGMAERLEVAPVTLEKYRAGERNPPLHLRLRLAALLEEQSRELAALAEALRETE